MLRKIIDFSIGVLGKLKGNQKISPKIDLRDGLVKVNLGSGLRVASGWLNIDGSLNSIIAAWPSWIHRLAYRFTGAHRYYTMSEYCDVLENNQFMYHDLSISLPLKNNTTDFIYTSHFLEHLFKDDAAVLLASCKAALKPGGTIRVSIPDLAYAISIYHLDRKHEMLNDFFFVEGKGSYLARHKYMYDFDLLKDALENAGFVNITRCEFKKGRTPDIGILDVYPDVSLFVEATKK